MMGFPVLTTLNLSYSYTLEVLPLQPNTPISAERDFINSDNAPTDPTGRIIEVVKTKGQNVFPFIFNVTFDQLLELQNWFRRGAFFLDTDENDATSRHTVIWGETQFTSPIEPGGRYTVSGTFLAT